MFNFVEVFLHSLTCASSKILVIEIEKKSKKSCEQNVSYACLYVDLRLDCTCVLCSFTE